VKISFKSNFQPNLAVRNRNSQTIFVPNTQYVGQDIFRTSFNPFYVDMRYPDTLPGSNDVFLDIYEKRLPDRKILLENNTCFAISSKYPCNGNVGHCLIMPKRQVKSFFDFTPKEIVDCFDLITKCKSLVGNYYHTDDLPFKIESYACGTQSIPHAHIHLIPMINTNNR